MANEDWAKDPNTRPEVLAMLSTSPSDAVRKLVAQNPATPDMALLHLARDTDDDVRKAVAHRSNVSSEALRIALLPREVLAELDAPASLDIVPPAPEVVVSQVPAAQVAVPETAPVAAEPVPAQPTEIVEPAPVPHKSSWLAWFWRLLGRTA